MSKPLKILVTGGRDYSNVDELYATLDWIHKNRGIHSLAHGGARGADELAGEWASERSVKTIVFPAEWEAFGRSAGPIRNRHMLETFNPDWVIAFKGGKGTANMVEIARKAGVRVTEVREGWSSEQ